MTYCFKPNDFNNVVGGRYQNSSNLVVTEVGRRKILTLAQRLGGGTAHRTMLDPSGEEPVLRNAPILSGEGTAPRHVANQDETYSKGLNLFVANRAFWIAPMLYVDSPAYTWTVRTPSGGGQVLWSVPSQPAG